MEHLIFPVCLVVLLFLIIPFPRKKSKRKAKKFGEGLLTDRPDSGNFNIWKY